MACLDTSVLLDLAGRGGKKRRREAAAKVAELQTTGEKLVTTRFTETELWVGVERSSDPKRERAAIEALLKPLEILDFDQLAARVFGRIVAYLQHRGQAIGDMHALIASVALAAGHSIATANPRHFRKVPGLRTETY